MNSRLLSIAKLALLVSLLVSCTSQKKLAYLSNLPEPDAKETFTLGKPDYIIQTRDVLYITAKALSSEGRIEDLLQSSTSGIGIQSGGETGGYLYGYEVKLNGEIRIPAIDLVKVQGLTIAQARDTIQLRIDKVFKNTTVDCKLLSFKFTVIGEVRAPGTFTNYDNYLTVLEAVGKAGGISDFGNRDRILVVRSTPNGSKTYRLNLQDKSILASEAYFLSPNDVLIVEQQKQKIFNQNLPTISFIISAFTSSVTMTLLLINYLK